MALTVKDALNNSNVTDSAQLMGRMQFGTVLSNMMNATWDSSARTVTDHIVSMVNASSEAVYGLVIAADATTAGSAGGKKLVSGTPAAGEVKLEYLSTGQPKLTFAAADTVTAAKIYWIEWPLSRNSRAPRAELLSGAA